MNGIILVIMKRLQATKSPRLALNVLLFLCVFLITVGKDERATPASMLIQLFDSLQPKLLAMVMNSMLLTNAPKIRDRHDRKIVLVGLTKMVTECPVLISGDADYTSLFIAIVSTIVTMLATLPGGGLGDAQGEEAEYDESGAAAVEEVSVGSFWKLRCCPLPRKCPPIDHLPDALPIFTNSLVALSRSLPSGRLVTLLSSMDASLQSALSSLLVQSNVSI